MQNEQKQGGAVMSEQDFIKLALAFRAEDRAELLEQIRAAVKAAKA